MVVHWKFHQQNPFLFPQTYIYTLFRALIDINIIQTKQKKIGKTFITYITIRLKPFFFIKTFILYNMNDVKPNTHTA